MDPEATLQAAHAAYTDNDFSTATARLSDYFQWRLRGGFQPKDGDERALNWMNAISVALAGL